MKVDTANTNLTTNTKKPIRIVEATKNKTTASSLLPEYMSSTHV